MQTSSITNKKFYENKLNKLLQLPTEILYLVMDMLHAQDLQRLSWTSRLLWHISRKYHFGIVSPSWEPTKISKIDAIPISSYRDGAWFNDIFYLPILYKENPICWILDLTTRPIEWTKIPITIDSNQYEPVKYYAAAAINDFIYIFGGLNDKGATTNVLYELNAHTFVLRVLKVNNEKEYPSPRMLHSLDVIDNYHLAMFGGRSFINHNSKNIYDSKEFAIYNIRTNKWIHQNQSTNVPYRRSLHSSYIMNKKLYIYGGQQFKCFSNLKSQIHDDEDISVFDFRKEKWYKLINPSTEGKASKILLSTSTDWLLTTSAYKKLVPGKRMCVALFTMHNRIAIFGGLSEKEGEPDQLMYLLSTIKHNWEQIRIKNLPQIEVLTFYWEGWNDHNGLFLIGKDKEDNLIMGWIRDSVRV
jgi:hypothetical protein